MSGPRRLLWRRLPAALLVGAGLAICGVVILVHAGSASVFVNSAGDDHDASPGDGICETGFDAMGHPNGICTLRAAIEEVNASGGGMIGSLITATVTPATPLPALSAPGTVMDPPGLTLDGSTAHGDGIVVSAPGITVENLTINHGWAHGIAVTGGGSALIKFDNIGIDTATGSVKTPNTVGVALGGSGGSQISFSVISGNTSNGVEVTSSGNVLYGNVIGLNAAAAAALGNGGSGVLVSAAGNFIGTPITPPPGPMGPGRQNVISGNAMYGVYVSSGAGMTVVANNYIGLDGSGMHGTGSDGKPLGNTLDGVHVDAVMATIGGDTTTPRTGNVISGNGTGTGGGAGVFLDGAVADGAKVQGNRIGTDVAGTTAIANMGNGVTVHGANGVSVGGAGPSGVPGRSPLGNIISGNMGDGIKLEAGPAAMDLGSMDSIQGNDIGVGADGKPVGADGKPMGNTGDGVHIDSVPGFSSPDVHGPPDTVGGLNYASGKADRCMGPCNVISANLGNGIEMDSAPGNSVFGNYIGTDVKGASIATLLTGGQPYGNHLSGVLLESSVDSSVGGTDHTIGGTSTAGGLTKCTGQCNIISGNLTDGILISGGALNTVLGNTIGTGQEGSTLGNCGDGVRIEMGASGNAVGTPASGAVNYIVDNGDNSSGVCPSIGPGHGVEITGAGTNANRVQQNAIGVGPYPTEAVLGNAKDGVRIGGGAAMNTVGGTDNTTTGSCKNSCNAIAANGLHGVEIDDAATTMNLVQGNFIGQSFTGGAHGNHGRGVSIDHSPENTIGGLTSTPGKCGAACNAVSHNDAGQVLITGDTATDNMVQGNFIGLEANGNPTEHAAQGLGPGVDIEGAPSNTIGGASAPGGPAAPASCTNACNVIASNIGHGVLLFDAMGSHVQGNFVGVDPTGTTTTFTGGGTTAGYGNADNGVHVQETAGAVVGGTADGLGNLIAGNGIDGVSLADAATATQVQGNLVGTNAAGSLTLGNTHDGVRIVDTTGVAGLNVVGGTMATTAGMCTGACNVISGNSGNGIEVKGALSGGNSVQGNFIGTDPTGKTRVANALDGVAIDGAPNTLVGGPGGFAPGASCTAPCNLISGNTQNGVHIANAGAVNDDVQGNFIGSDVTGTVVLANFFNGVKIESTDSDAVGGAPAAGGSLGNLISGNITDGLQIKNGGPAGDAVDDNFIGLATGGAGNLPNTVNGIDVIDSPNVSIGVARRNNISANGADGVLITGAMSTGDRLENNCIGTDSLCGFRIQNTTNGVELAGGAAGDFIGAPGAGNVISGNLGDGVLVQGAGTTNNLVQANFIGSDLAGTGAIANNGNGVEITGATGTLVGGPVVPGMRNVIAFNGASGIIVTGAAATGNQIQQNSIFSNTKLGIDLGDDGVTPDHLGGPVAGPNDLQDFPVLTSALAAGSSTIYTGNLNGAASTAYTVELFTNPACDPSGYGQGKTLIGTIATVTDGSGNAHFSATLVPALASGTVVTSTATNTTAGDPAEFDTSEFSKCIVVGPLYPAVSFSPSRLDFGHRGSGTTTAHTVTVLSTGTASLNIASITVSGMTSDFVISANTCPAVLDPTKTCLVTVSFTPQADGTRIAFLVVSDDAADSPQKLPLSGTSGPGRYHALAPTRSLDTRNGTGTCTPSPCSTLGPNSSIDVQITGRAGIPNDGSVIAVVLNVTVTDATAGSFLTVYPAGSFLPLASNLNFRPGETVPNLVEVAVGSGGRVSAYNAAGSVDVIFDVAGYYSGTAGGSAGLFRPLAPARIMDTRAGTPHCGGGGSSACATLGPGGVLTLQVTGNGGVPADGSADSVVVNATVTNPTAGSYLTVYPAGQAQPVASNLNFGPGQTVPNRVIVKLGPGGRLTIFNAAGSVDVIIDVNGYYTSSSAGGTAGGYTPLSPARIMDTRAGPADCGAGGGSTCTTLGPGASMVLQVGGNGGAPATPTAVVLNVTVTNPTSGSFLTAYPSDQTLPTASDLNFAAGETVPNLVVVKLSSSGTITIFNAVGSVDVIVDLEGWFG